MSETLYTIKEIADKCGKNPRTIRYFTDSEKMGKKHGKEWKFTENEAKAIFRHYGAISAIEEIEEKTDGNTENTKEETEIETEIAEDNKTAGQIAILEVKLEQMEKRLQEQKESMRETIDSQKEEIIFLRSQVNSLTEKNERLQLENDGMKNQMLLKAAESQESNDEVINIPFQEEIEVDADIQEKEEIETDAATPENIQEQTNVMEDFKKQLRGMSIFDFWKFRKTL